jgi:hypothetical protein
MGGVNMYQVEDTREPESGLHTYKVKVTCEYYVDVEAHDDDEALELAIEADYNLSDLQNFDYEVEYYE